MTSADIARLAAMLDEWKLGDISSERLAEGLLAAVLPQEAGAPPAERLYEIAERIRQVGSLDNAVSYLRTVWAVSRPEGDGAV